MQLLLVCKPDTRVFHLARELLGRLSDQGIGATVIGHQDLATYDGPRCQAVVVLGGDGTIINAARHFACEGIPVMGVNFGKIGFLASTEIGEAVAAVDKIIRGEYQVEKRMMLQVAVIRESCPVCQVVALNDAVIRAAHCHTAGIDFWVNGNLYGRHRGDGVICATPTGSTGYSLSAGGPVLDSSLESIIVTPISPQLYLSRSLVLGADCRLVFQLDSDRAANLYIDGEDVMTLQRGDQVQVACALQKARIIQFDEFNRFMKLSNLRKDNGFKIEMH